MTTACDCMSEQSVTWAIDLPLRAQACFCDTRCLLPLRSRQAFSKNVRSPLPFLPVPPHCRSVLTWGWAALRARLGEALSAVALETVNSSIIFTFYMLNYYSDPTCKFCHFPNPDSPVVKIKFKMNKNSFNIPNIW